jgi:hypothetical protein
MVILSDVNTEIASPSVEPSVEPVSEFGISDSTTEGEVVNVSESIVPLPSVLSYKTENKRYLQTEARLSRHPIWRKAGFWELALLEGIVNQMGLSEQPILWDELSPDALREAVIGKFFVVITTVQILTMTFQGYTTLFLVNYAHYPLRCTNWAWRPKRFASFGDSGLFVFI